MLPNNSFKPTPLRGAAYFKRSASGGGNFLWFPNSILVITHIFLFRIWH
ncbi:MAG: hypothetical protein BWX80_02511 [Candidatus Hydrogenedentes bacterium ADurb.Bin101]|jgi:hypothetical protein|nr:MAG: hypothetical protein BWX80_02511 [Candidatus Hydrogenedentes bacterium ADurb.Bin101]